MVVTERDYEAFCHRPFGLVELVIGRSSHVFATCLPRWMNWPILQAFLEPITHSGHYGIQMMRLLNGVSLDWQLVRCYNGFFVQVFITASPWVLGELSQNAPLVRTHCIRQVVTHSVSGSSGQLYILREGTPSF